MEEGILHTDAISGENTHIGAASVTIDEVGNDMTRPSVKSDNNEITRGAKHPPLQTVVGALG